ncbi:MAG: hypothetical protein ACOY3Y_01390 [Acidobacteriota bacterium]
MPTAKRARTPKKSLVRLTAVGGMYVVNPPALMVKPGTEIYFTNSTPDRVLVFVPQARELFVRKPAWEVIEVPRSRTPKKLGTVAAQPVDFPQVYSYAVFVASDESFAVGGSNPRIIVY